MMLKVVWIDAEDVYAFVRTVCESELNDLTGVRNQLPRIHGRSGVPNEY